VTDRRLAELRQTLAAIEAETRAHWQASPDVEEQEHALMVVRLVTPVYREIDRWVISRLTRAHRYGG
jgi:hypothetical protein